MSDVALIHVSASFGTKGSRLCLGSLLVSPPGAMSPHCPNCVRRWPQTNPGCSLCQLCPWCLVGWLGKGWYCHHCDNTRHLMKTRMRCTIRALPTSTLVHMLCYCGLDDSWGRLYWISRTFREAARQRRRLDVIRDFPTYAVDEISWGPATTCWPYPSWGYWEIRVVVYISGRFIENPPRWILWRRQWVRSLEEVAGVWSVCETTGGLYNRLVIQLEQWEWSYQYGWERVDHL